MAATVAWRVTVTVFQTSCEHYWPLLGNMAVECVSGWPLQWSGNFCIRWSQKKICDLEACHDLKLDSELGLALEMKKVREMNLQRRSELEESTEMN